MQSRWLTSPTREPAVAAGLPIVCGISAPSSLAVDLARQFGVTLIGFLRQGRFNLYAGEERIVAGDGGAGVRGSIAGRRGIGATETRELP